MTSAQLRQSFLDFFQEKKHTIVPSASLMPTSPNLLFTNAGMNQFIPYFLGTEAAPYSPPRAADTQKCIRAGGKHNDLDDVGYDTYHHTFFEMLGNWSFGDYFKTEAIEWGWELLTKRWGFPAERLYATVYRPSEGDPADFDQEAYDCWKAIFEKAGLDPAVHIVDGGKKDNFWMMGETGPCGPCSELHIDLTPAGDTGGKLVNQDDSACIEIWNLVFIQYNAEADGTFRALPARHVDTGMGFERAASVKQCTKDFTDFSKLPSNYDADIFTGIFKEIADLSGKSYTGTVPEVGQKTGFSDQEKYDIAFRVVADHLRTLSFSIADGILPGNTDRNYVLRRILRRAVRYGRTLGLGEDGSPFLTKLFPALLAEMGTAFPELEKRKDAILKTFENEEGSFNKTLDRGLALFEKAAADLAGAPFPSETAFELYDTFGFPVDLTRVLCEERGIILDEDAVEIRLEQARELSRSAHSSSTVRALDISTEHTTEFVGYEHDSCDAIVLERIPASDDPQDGVYLIVDKCPLFTEMGGQVADTGAVFIEDEKEPVLAVQKVGNATALLVLVAPTEDEITIHLGVNHRRAVENHHTATHILHWALHQVVGEDVAQQGSVVDHERLRFDFNSAALTAEQVKEVEALVNAKIEEDAEVSITEVLHENVKERQDIMQFFGDKYGEKVRVVQIGGKPGRLDGYSMELCGGTHVNKTSEIGKFVIKSEGAIAAGIRRIEATCGEAATSYLQEVSNRLREEITAFYQKLTTANQGLAEADATQVATPQPGSAETVAGLTENRDALREAAAEAEKALKKAQVNAAAANAALALADLLASGETRIVQSIEGDPALLQELLNGLKKRGFEGAAIFIVDDGEKLHLGASVAKDLTNEFQAGKIITQLAALAGGKGGGKPEQARGAAPDRDKKPEVEAAAKAMFA